MEPPVRASIEDCHGVLDIIELARVGTVDELRSFCSATSSDRRLKKSMERIKQEELKRRIRCSGGKVSRESARSILASLADEEIEDGIGRFLSDVVFLSKCSNGSIVFQRNCKWLDQEKGRIEIYYRTAGKIGCWGHDLSRDAIWYVVSENK